jgi:transcriptional regulator with XRE-family HTH domain
MEHRKLVGQNVRRLRNQKGWTQEKLGMRAGVDQGYLGTLERGRVNVSIDTLAKLGKALKVKIDEFLRAA